MRTILCILVWLLLATLDLCAASFGESIAFKGAAAIRPAAGGGGGGTPAFVDFTLGGGGSGSATQLKVTNTVTAGDTIIIGAGWEDTVATVSATNTAGDTFSVMTQTNAAGAAFSAMLYTIASAGGTITHSVNFSAGSPYSRIGVWRLSGVTAMDLDKWGAAASGAPGTAASTATGSTANAVEVLVAVTKNYGGAAATPQGSWTEDSDNVASLGVHFQHYTTSSSGTYGGAATLGSSQYWSMNFGAFK